MTAADPSSGGVHSTAYLRWLTDRIVPTSWFAFAWGAPENRVLDHPVGRDVPPFRSLRLTLPGRSILHLAGLAVRPSPALAAEAVAAGLTLDMSSVLGESLRGRSKETYLEWARENWVSVGDEPPYEMLHTTEDTDPFITVHFDEPCPLQTVAVRNRRDAWGFRAGGLVVSGTDNHGKEHVLADMRELRSALRRASAPDAFPGPLERADHCWALWHDLWDLLCDGKAPASQSAWVGVFRDRATKTESHARQSAIQYLNDALLKPGGRALGQHGIRKPFSAKPRHEVEQELMQAVELADRLDALGYDACLGFGSALGFARNGEVIPHDDDVDLLAVHRDCECSTRDDCMTHLARVLQPVGYRVSGDHAGHRWVSNGNVFDVFVGMATAVDSVDFLVGARSYRHALETIFPKAFFYFKSGIRAPLPRNIGAYVEEVYGPTWSVPDPGFVH